MAETGLVMLSNSPSASQPSSARVPTSVLLANGVSRLEVTLKLTTAILALAAGVYTYLGVRELLNGSPTTVLFAALIYSVAVSVGIYAFWVFLMQFMPHVVGTGRGLMFGCMLLGSLMIVAMSSWLNASALAGAAAIQQHLAITVQDYTRDLNTANTNAIAAQGLLPDIQLASSRFTRLADAERAGSLTGTAGSGTVVQLLTQMAGQLDSLGQQVQESAKRVSGLYEQGGTADLADRQTAVVGKVESSIATQAQSLADAADKILAMPHVEPARFQTLSPAEAVLRYASDFIPSWAGAISIDLMPAVLVLILCVVHAAIRREGTPVVSASTITAGELVAALQIAREVADARRGVEEAKPAPKPEPEPKLEPEPAPTIAEEPKPTVPEENVTSLSSARHTK